MTNTGPILCLFFSFSLKQPSLLNIIITCFKTDNTNAVSVANLQLSTVEEVLPTIVTLVTQKRDN